MQIVGYKKLKGNKYQVTIKNKGEITLYDDVILKFNLLIDKNISPEKLRAIMEYNDELSSYYKALKYIAIKMRTKKETQEYLKKNNVSANIIAKTIARLEKQGYINEEKYVHYYILDQVNLTLNGPAKIKQALLKQNLKEEVITKSLRVVNLAEEGVNIPFYNIIEMEKILLNNNS